MHRYINFVSIEIICIKFINIDKMKTDEIEAICMA